jgi:hypothetical protein
MSEYIKKVCIRGVAGFTRSIVWLVWDFSGIRFIYSKIRLAVSIGHKHVPSEPVSPQTLQKKRHDLDNARLEAESAIASADVSRAYQLFYKNIPALEDSVSAMENNLMTEHYREPVTLTIWLYAIYIILFVSAVVRFENGVKNAEQESYMLISQLSQENYKMSLGRLGWIQQRDLCAIEPLFLNPHSVFASIFLAKAYCENVAQNMRDVVVGFKDDLKGVNLSHVYLKQAQLDNANLQKADLSNTNLAGANLQDANLKNADLSGANLAGANLQGAQLRGANLKNAINLTVKQLMEVENLYPVIGIELEMRIKLRKVAPQLFKKK